jgi:hypothetical protein
MPEPEFNFTKLPDAELARILAKADSEIAAELAGDADPWRSELIRIAISTTLANYMIPLLLGDPDAGGAMLTALFIAGVTIAEFTDKPAMDDDTLNVRAAKTAGQLRGDNDWMTSAANIINLGAGLIAQGQRDLPDALDAVARCAIVVARERREKTE